MPGAERAIALCGKRLGLIRWSQLTVAKWTGHTQLVAFSGPTCHPGRATPGSTPLARNRPDSCTCRVAQAAAAAINRNRMVNHV